MRSFILAAGVALAFTAVGRADPHSQPPITVMSFNLRYATAPDGDDSWAHRKEFVSDLIKKSDPDLIGTQEGLASQLQFLQNKLPGYTFIGAGRDDGKDKGEFSAVFVKAAKFDIVAKGHFWLSETPKVPGSKSWDSSLPRMATWVQLARRDLAGQPTVFFVNTHWDHRGPKARLESAKVMRQWARDTVKDQPLIVTGDCNCHETSEPIKHLLTGSTGDTPWTDSYRSVHPSVQRDEASFHGFKGTTRGSRIDFILHSPQFRTLAANIDRTQRDGRFPSDHYPVTATLVWQSKK